MKRYLIYSWLLGVACLMGCSKEEAEYSTWPCRFAYDNMVHQDEALSLAMDANSRGTFCTISETVRKGVKYLCFHTSNGKSTEQQETAEEQQANFILGINNGIIVGFQTLNTDGPSGGFVGYDIQCPNCARRENNLKNPNYRVSIDNNGIATCPKCHKTYDLNNGGLIRNGEEGDTGLEKYVATTTGILGYISVFRR